MRVFPGPRHDPSRLGDCPVTPPSRHPPTVRVALPLDAVQGLAVESWFDAAVHVWNWALDLQQAEEARDEAPASWHQRWSQLPAETTRFPLLGRVPPSVIKCELERLSLATLFHREGIGPAPCAKSTSGPQSAEFALERQSSRRGLRAWDGDIGGYPARTLHLPTLGYVALGPEAPPSVPFLVCVERRDRSHYDALLTLERRSRRPRLCRRCRHPKRVARRFGHRGLCDPCRHEIATHTRRIRATRPFEQCYSCIVCKVHLEVPPGYNFCTVRCRKSIRIALADFPALPSCCRRSATFRAHCGTPLRAHYVAPARSAHRTLPRPFRRPVRACWWLRKSAGIWRTALMS